MTFKKRIIERLKRYKGKIGADLAISIVEQECREEAEKLQKRYDANKKLGFPLTRLNDLQEVIRELLDSLK